MLSRTLASLPVLLSMTLLSGCGGTPLRPVTMMSHVDLPRFMGDWYVIASIPTFIEKDIYNAVESYSLDRDGTIATTFRFNKGGYAGPLKEYTPRGFVLDATHARWGMRFIWPIKADYRISYVSPDYRLTVVGRAARDYVWLMARSPDIDPEDYDRLVNFIRDEGYDMTRLVRIPHGRGSQGY